MTDLKQRIETEIVNRILVGEYHSGEILKEESIAAEFSASRTPVREVLRSIVAKGQADYVAGRGTAAPNPDLLTTISLLEALELIIPINTRLSVERIGEAELPRLSHFLGTMAAHAHDASVPAFTMEYWQWVQVVLNGSGNIYLIDADYTITFHVHRLRALAMRRWSESRVIAQKQWTIAYCTELTNAFLSRSVELASKVVSNETGKLRKDIASTLLGI